MVFPVSEDLAPFEKNRINGYLPVRKQGNEFSWDTITGIVLGYALKKQIGKYDFTDFKDDCKAAILEKLDQPDFWETLERMYFASEAVFNVSPFFLLFKAQRNTNGKYGLSSADQRMGELFANLMGKQFELGELAENVNFIENELLAALKDRLEPLSDGLFTEEAYLPYLATAFQQDMSFLSEHPKYLVQEFTNTLKLYAFAYCSQLALNIRSWRSGDPAPKPLYFILDTEKASSERALVRNCGYKFLLEACADLFPLLCALEPLQHENLRRPLWRVYSDASSYQHQSELLERLNKYIAAFVASRELQSPATATSVEEAFAQIVEASLEQFRDKPSNREKPGVNRAYVRQLDRYVYGDFAQSRGRAGRVLVLNQDYLLLLTNLAIGTAEKLRLHELVVEFRRRGFYLDNQSQQMLVAFYERMGNVERMSDSGDAVYVRKTV